MSVSTRPWTFVYQPQRLDEMGGPCGILFQRLSSCPHLILCGPQGTGKNTALTLYLKALSNYFESLYGSKVDNYILWLNGSEDRGIDVIRTKVKRFAQRKGHPSGIPSYIIMDEGDCLTIPAQEALRRMMEVYSQHTRLCLLGNHIEKIIEPIQSRCQVFFFLKVSPREIYERLIKICHSEKIKEKDSRELKKVSSQENLQSITYFCHGDVRAAINLLQLFTVYPSLPYLMGEVSETLWRDCVTPQLSCMQKLQLSNNLLAENVHLPYFFRKLQTYILKHISQNGILVGEFFLILSELERDYLQSYDPLLLLQLTVFHFQNLL